ncbi:MAG: dephospho-CoA kinase, partial [Clostridiales bacterium]
GAAVIDADLVGHQIIAPGTPAYNEIIAAFPGDFLKPGGAIDRKKLGVIVFGDATGAFVRRLNQITHPQISRIIRQTIADYKRVGYVHIVVEAALLLQCDLVDQVDVIWLITAPEKVVLNRLQQRDGMGQQQAEARMAAQSSEAVQRAAADLVIVNDGDREQLKKKLTAAYLALPER